MKEYIYKKSRILILLICLISVSISLTACNQNKEIVKDLEEDEVTSSLPEDDNLKASDTAIVINIDQNLKTIIFQTITSSERYEVTFDGITEFYDKYGQALSSAQINKGDIVDVIVSIHSKKLNSLQLATGYFEKTRVDSYSIKPNKGMLSIGNDNYKISADLPVFFGEYVGKLSDINENDVLTLKGIDRNIYSVTVDSGHGYVRLIGEEYFKGGWIECGKVIKPITENMLLLVPEGKYEMRVTYHGFGGTKSVTVTRDKETLVDVSDLKGELLKTGKVSISVVPDNADVYINGEKTDYNIPIELEYGVYQVDIVCSGYKSLRKYLSVGNENATVTFNLEESDGTDEESEDSEPNTLPTDTNKDSNLIYNIGSKTTSSSSVKDDNIDTQNTENTNNTLQNTPRNRLTNSTSVKNYEDNDRTMLHEDSQTGEDIITTTAQVYIDSPEGVEVYFDGSYKGIAPINFTKEAGTHVVTLRKDGFVTKSYTLTLGNTDADETYSFNMLIAE